MNQLMKKKLLVEVDHNNEHINDATHPLEKFYSKTSLHTVICNYLASKTITGKKASFEEIVNYVNKRLGSRSTILNCLKEGCECEVFVKSGCDSDRRLRNYEIQEKSLDYLVKNRNELYEKLLQQEGKL